MGYEKFPGILSTFSPDFPVKDSWEFPRIPRKDSGEFPRIFRKIVTWEVTNSGEFPESNSGEILESDSRENPKINSGEFPESNSREILQSDFGENPKFKKIPRNRFKIILRNSKIFNANNS